MIIFIFGLYPKMRQHSQAVYKLSLAFSDLLMGALGFPTLFTTFWMSTNDVRVFQKSNVSSSSLLPFYKVPRYNIPYVHFAGFVLCLSITVTMYTLAAAALDRLMAVHKPLLYCKETANRVAKKACLVIWIVSTIFCLFPVFLPAVQYLVVLSFLSTMAGKHALVIYAIVGALPLIAMWIFSIATYRCSKKYTNIRKRLASAKSRELTNRMEHRLAKTLVTMVGAFTACTLPAVLVLLVALFLRNVYPSQPERFEPQTASSYYLAQFVAFLIVACNSLCSFFIYSWRHVEFRKALKMLPSSASNRIGLSSFARNLQNRCRSVVHHGRRRLSYFPNFSTESERKRSSASDTKQSSASTKETYAFPDENAMPETPAHLSNSDKSTTNLSVNYHSRSEPRQTQPNVNSWDQEDSVFDSFAIDVRADRLFMSVMDNIEEEPEKEEAWRILKWLWTYRAQIHSTFSCVQTVCFWFAKTLHGCDCTLSANNWSKTFRKLWKPRTGVFINFGQSRPENKNQLTTQSVRLTRWTKRSSIETKLPSYNSSYLFLQQLGEPREIILLMT